MADTVTPQFYDAVGALNGTFAPAYIPGYAPSQAAVQAWQASRGGGGGSGLSPADVQSTAMPGGYVDPAALQAMAWNQPYDLNARRNAVAQAVQAQQARAAAAQAPAQPFYGGNPYNGGYYNTLGSAIGNGLTDIPLPGQVFTGGAGG